MKPNTCRKLIACVLRLEKAGQGHLGKLCYAPAAPKFHLSAVGALGGLGWVREGSPGPTPTAIRHAAIFIAICQAERAAPQPHVQDTAPRAPGSSPAATPSNANASFFALPQIPQFTENAADRAPGKQVAALTNTLATLQTPHLFDIKKTKNYWQGTNHS